MGYESKIIIVDRHEHKNGDGETIWTYGAEIARFDLSKMGYDYFDGKMFPELFDTPIDFDLDVNQSDEDEAEDFYKVDLYGAHCKYTTDIDGVIAWLEQSEAKEHYRRAALFLDFLRVLKAHLNEYSQIVLVHYGY